MSSANPPPSQNPNPYQSPHSMPPSGAMGGPLPYSPVHLEHLRNVASYQRGIQLAILAQIISYIALVAIQEPLVKQVMLGVFAIAGIAGAVYVFLLANQLWGVVWAVIATIFSLVPCLGLLALLRVNSAATGTLQEAGYSVGLLGADLAQFDQPPPNMMPPGQFPGPPPGQPPPPPNAP